MASPKFLGTENPHGFIQADGFWCGVRQQKSVFEEIGRRFWSEDTTQTMDDKYENTPTSLRIHAR